MPPHKKRKVKTIAGTQQMSYRLPEERGRKTEQPRQHLAEASLMQYMDQSMYQYLRNLVTGTFKNTSKKKIEKALNDLKEKQYNLKSVPRGLLEIGDMLAGGIPWLMQGSLQKYKLKATKLWENYVDIIFDDIVDVIKDELNFEDDEHNEEGETDEEEIACNTNSSIELRRCCIAPLTKILRVDLSDYLRNHFLKVVDENIKATTDYYLDVATAVMCTCISLKTFLADEHSKDTILENVIPSRFLNSNFTDRPSIVDFRKLDAKSTIEYNTLFSFSHLQFICSSNFGVRGLRSESSNLHPLWQDLQNHMLENSTANFEANKLPSTVKQNVFQQFATNMANMWAKNRMFHKSIDHLLLVLLRLHLRPKKEAIRLNKLNDKAKKASSNKKKDESKKYETRLYTTESRDRKFSIIKKERANMAKLEAKIARDPTNAKRSKWEKGLEECEERLKRFRSLVVTKKESSKKDDEERLKRSKSFAESREEAQDDGDENQSDRDEEDVDIDEVTANQDISCRRLSKLKGILRKMLLEIDKPSVSEVDIISYDNDLSDNEKQVFIRLFNNIKPYITLTPSSPFMSHQLRFVSFANDILSACRYSQYVQDISPMPSSAALHSLALDSPTIYSLFCSSKERGYYLYKEDGSAIRDSRDATWNQNACFGAFFDLKAIDGICASSGLRFAHYINVRPGCKTVSVMGKLEKVHSSNRTSRYKKRPADNNIPAIVLSEENEVQLKREMEDLQSTIETLNAKLSTLTKAKNSGVYKKDKAIKDLKAKWPSPKTEALYKQIRQLKADRFQEFQEVDHVRKSLKSARSQLYWKKQTLQKSKTSAKRKRVSKKTSTVPRTLPSIDSPGCVDMANFIDLSHFQNQGATLTFAGTDYGFHTLAVTSPVTMERYEFHCQLYKQQQGKESQSKDYPLSFLKLPRTFQIKSGDLNQKALTEKFRHSLTRRKKNTDAGRAAKAQEDCLAKLSRPSNAESCWEYCKSKKQSTSILRSFYWSKRSVKQIRTAELFGRKIKDRVAASERAFVKKQSGDGDVFPIHCIGNQGTGVGSTIKGFNRRGGRWLIEKHGRYGTVAITNEFRTSQTCIFCFGQVIRPQNGDGKKDNGSSRCLNPDCPSYVHGRAIQGRDVQASVAIALAGISTMMSSQPLHPFNPRMYLE